jgi:diguanylate cyclase (GGDEF)-like protein
MQREEVRHASPTSAAGVLDSMLDGVIVVGDEDRLLYCNPAGRALLGPFGAVGSQFFAKQLEDGSCAEVPLFESRIAELSSVRIEWDGEPARLLTLRDVTQRRRTEASLVILADQLRTANVHLRMLADIDPLTGLLNRRGLERILESEILPRVREGTDLVAIMVDCDEFKAVNDTYDHVAGDLALREIGERLRGALRPGDPLARVGGDEFLVLLPGARLDAALRVAGRIREAVACKPVPIAFRESEIALTVSLGVAPIPRDASHVDDIVRLADAGLRQSKLSGKNRVTSSTAPRRLSIATGA